MNIHRRTWSALPALLVLFFVNAGNTQDISPGPSIIGIDHMPTAVRNLDHATDAYREMGFALKPGRFHDNGLRNNHVKFEDGSGIELISPLERPMDELSARYVDFLKQGDGPAFIMFHARKREDLTVALRSSGFKLKDDGNGMDLDEPLLDFLFFGQDNRSPTDGPEHFAHANTAFGMTGVWLALDDVRRERLVRLLTVLGAKASKESILAPDPAGAEVFAVQNGRVVVLPKRHQLQDGRPIVGAEFRVRSAAKTPCGRRAGVKRCLVPPSAAHGLWLEFHE